MAQGLRVAVTGATGNIGTSVVEALTEDERVGSILGIARRWSSWSTSKLEQVTADVSEDDLTPLFSDVDVVVHLAWLFQPTRDPLTTWVASLVVGVALFVVAAVLGAAGTTMIRRSTPPVPERAVASVREDVEMLKGRAHR